MDKLAPAISVIIPTVGRSELAEALRSLVSQSFTDFKVVIGNDSGKPTDHLL